MKIIFGICILIAVYSCSDKPVVVPPPTPPQNQSIADKVSGTYNGTATRIYKVGDGSCLCYSTFNQYQKTDAATIIVTKNTDSTVSISITSKNGIFQSYNLSNTVVRESGNQYYLYNIIRGNGSFYSPFTNFVNNSINGLFDQSYGYNSGCASQCGGVNYSFEKFDKIEFSGTK